MKIEYGTDENKIDVTEICYTKLLSNNIITIPNGDHPRASYFGDPCYGFFKYIYITLSDNTIYNYNYNPCIKINILNENILIDDSQINTLTTNNFIIITSYYESSNKQRQNEIIEC